MKNQVEEVKKYYNVNNIRYYDAKNKKWLQGNGAIKHMKCIRSDNGNWDLYLNKNTGWIYYVSVYPDCHSGFWGTVEYFQKRYGHPPVEVPTLH